MGFDLYGLKPKIKKGSVRPPEIDWNKCWRGISIHYWYLFKCNVSGEIKQNHIETKSIGWYDVDEIKKLKLEPAWEYWFKKLKII